VLEAPAVHLAQHRLQQLQREEQDDGKKDERGGVGVKSPEKEKRYNPSGDRERGLILDQDVIHYNTYLTKHSL